MGDKSYSDYLYYRKDGNLFHKYGWDENYANYSETRVSYDNLGRLKTESISLEHPSGYISKDFTYTYDKRGNRLTKTGSENYNYTYDKSNRLKQEIKDLGAKKEVTDYVYACVIIGRNQ